MDVQSWRLQIQTYMSQIGDVSTLAPALQTLSHLLLSSHEDGCTTTEFCDSFIPARRCFISGLYEQLLYRLLERMSEIEVMAKNGKLICKCFVEGVPDISFEVLSAGLSERYGLLCNETCISYLTQLVTTNQMVHIINTRCFVDSQMCDGEHDSLVQAMVSLPDRVANRFGKNVPECLRRDTYYALLYHGVLSGLHQVKYRMEMSLPSSVAFASQLIGKLCMAGLGMDLWRVLLANIMVSHDFLISRVFHKVVVGIPLKALDATVIPLLRSIHHHEDVAALLGNTILDTKRLEHLLVDKMLLQKYYTTEDVPKLLYNIIGYLVSSPTRVHFYYSMFIKLLTVWADSSSIRCISLAQHLYISKAIVVCATLLNGGEEDYRMELMRILMDGLQKHLSSSDISLRHTGMAVAEIVSEKINPQQETRLKFEYDTSDIYDELKALTSPPTAPGIQAYQSSDTVQINGNTGAVSESTAPEMAAADLDSDDDLEPIGQFEDKPRSKEKAPAYVGDCMQGLMDEENPERVESCLKSADKLIRSNAAMTQEVAVEFAKILLHMGCTLAIDNYMQYRQRSIVSLLVVSPMSVADYLCNQFTCRNYNVRQRLDMLDALAAAAAELSHPVTDQGQTTSQLSHDLTSLDISGKSEEPDWRQVVESRIKSKTRRFASATVPTPQGSANRFAAVAGHFFFPLLAAGREADAGGYNPLTADSILLVQYLYTLGKVTGSAQHCPLAARMAAELMDLIWVFRCSGEVAVRKAALFCIAMVVLVVPASELLSERYHMSDTIAYLQLLIERDPDPEIQDMSVKVLSYLQHQLSLGLTESSNNSS